jgi:hypothetical protein
MTSAKQKLEAVLSHRYIFLFAALLGFLMALPSLGGGLWMDDYQQRVALLSTLDGNPFEFYRMGTPQTEALLQSGILPWWTHPVSKLVFFRPIAHWLMQIDYQLWPNSVAIMHLHSIFWYAALVAVVGLVYRRFTLWPLAAGFSAILFAVDFGHGGAVAWLANRNAMVAMTASMLALLCYQKKVWYWQFLGCIFFAASMASAEAALAITGYFFAYEIFLSKQRWLWRFMRLLPYALIALFWLAFWHQRGYGSAGPGFYTDPANDPGEFIRGVIYRAPAFLFGQLTVVPVEIFWILENSQWRNYAFAAVLATLGFFVIQIFPVFKNSALARFYFLGMCIAAIPICGSQLVGRSLWYVGFGAIGLLGLLFERFFSVAVENRRRGFTLFAGTMLILHLVVSPLMFMFGIVVGPLLDNYMDSRTLQLSDERGSNKNILVVSAVDFEMNTYYPMLKDEALSIGTAPMRLKSRISKVLSLTNGVGDFELWQEDDDTLVVRRDSGFAEMRKGKYGFTKGERVALDDVDITVREITEDRAATEIEYHFKPGALSNYGVVAWQGGHFSPLQLPDRGMRIMIRMSST